MPSEKRQRKRDNRQVRREELVRLQRRSHARRRVITAVVIVALGVGLVALITAANSGDDEQEVATRSSTTTTGKTAAAPPTPCPPADGSAEKQQTFEAPFEMCIDEAKTYVAEMETDAGAVVIELDAKKAPKTVNNFVNLARHHFYDDVTFHRVIPGFVVQGGDPEGTGSGGPGYEFEDELPEAGDYAVGSLAMANSGPDTNGSQFFVVTGQQGVELPPNYSLFGRVTEGMDVVKKIEADGSESGEPKVTHRILKITVKES